MSGSEINLYAFIEVHSDDQGSAQENILETGNVQRVVSYIESSFPGSDEGDLRGKIFSLLHSICQSRNSASRNAFKCNGILTRQFLALVKSNSEAARIATTILQDEGLSEIPQFQKEAECASYISKRRFHNGKTLTNTRFSHHLSQSLGKIRVMSKGAAYVGIGASLIANGYLLLSNAFFSDEPYERKFVASILITAGFGFVSIPFVGAFIQSGQNQP